MHSAGMQAKRPDGPSMMVSLTSLEVGATMAMRAPGVLDANQAQSSHDVLVLPKPRPANSSQMRQSPLGVICSGLACFSHAIRFCAAALLSCGNDAKQAINCSGGIGNLNGFPMFFPT